MSLMERVRKNLRDNMKKLRQEREWNQDQLAEKSGLSTGYIKRIETCSQWPSPASIESIAKALEVEVSDLYMDHLKVHRETTLEEALRKIGSDLGYEIKKKTA